MEDFLKQHTCYDVLPVSFRLVVFDTHLSVKKALSMLVKNGIVSAPLWSSDTQQYAGMLTVSDFIHLIQYYYNYPSKTHEIQTIEIAQLKSKGYTKEWLKSQQCSIHPMTTLHAVALLMAKTKAHRIPLVIENSEIISVITQYRLMKFIANNFKKTDALKVPLSELGIGTFGEKVSTATLSTPVIKIIDIFAEKNISAIPIIDEKGIVLNLYDTIDVMSLVRSERYSHLNLPVGEAMKERPLDFPGVSTCTLNDTLYSIFKAIRKQRVYRLVIIEPDTSELIGLLSLSDILGYLVGNTKV
ncbi:activating gamma subunit of the AMP-activated Snf1p kinase complex [Backusella circina FSU 941]|nr:activating gamma subunit of the AMP-activated Snf1p kinase complex [Backusella circina FSU 941]